MCEMESLAVERIRWFREWITTYTSLAGKTLRIVSISIHRPFTSLANYVCKSMKTITIILSLGLKHILLRGT
jgi:hypothetical protein